MKDIELFLFAAAGTILVAVMVAYVAGFRLLDKRCIAAVKIFAEALGVNYGPFLLVFHVVTPFWKYTFFHYTPAPEICKEFAIYVGLW